MANRNQGGFGLRPVNTLGNSPATSGQSKYQIENGAAFNIYNGEPVILDRTVVAAAGGFLTNGCASAGTLFLGVFNGCFFNAVTTAKPTWSNAYLSTYNTGVVSGELVTAFVNDNPFQEYEIALTAATGAAPITENTIQAQFGGLADTSASGTSTGGRSNCTLAAPTASGAGAHGWAALRRAEDPDNSDFTAAYASVIVVQNLKYSQTIAGSA